MKKINYSFNMLSSVLIHIVMIPIVLIGYFAITMLDLVYYGVYQGIPFVFTQAKEMVQSLKSKVTKYMKG